MTFKELKEKIASHRDSQFKLDEEYSVQVYDNPNTFNLKVSMASMQFVFTEKESVKAYFIEDGKCDYENGMEFSFHDKIDKLNELLPSGATNLLNNVQEKVEKRTPVERLVSFLKNKYS